MDFPAYGVLREVSPVAAVLLENNPSSMTLEGTNTWVLRAPGADACVIVDPGYEDLEHLRLLTGVGPVALILLTHEHPDHVEGAPWLARETGAPVRALDPGLCLGDVESFVDESVISAAGLDIRVIHTPGHTADSVSFRIDHGGRAQVLTGDTILGRGTTVLGDLGAYLRSLRTLAALPEGTLGLPGHGPELPDLAATARGYLAHREERLDQVRGALRELGADATPRQIVEHVYADVDPVLWAPAESSVRAQLAYLRDQRP